MSRRALAWAAAPLALLSALTAIAADPMPATDDAPGAVLGANGLWQALPLPPGPPPIGRIPNAILEAAASSLGLPIGERMVRVSQPMLGRPYALDPLGEGQGFDPDPIARYDAYDCLTFVEETLAFAFSADPVHAADVRHALRYGDAPAAYENRRHFMELQWIPGNVADGWIVDTTKTYGPTVHKHLDVTLDSWRRWRKRAKFHLTDAQLPLGQMDLDVLPIDDAIAAAPRIPTGAIVLTLRDDTFSIPYWTTHLGFVVQTDHGAMFRNAAKRSKARVVDEPLEKYLRNLRLYRYPIAGVVVLEPVEPIPRRTALPAPPGSEDTFDH